LVHLRDTTICILAGGLGSRIASEFPDLPKCLVPVAGEPFIFHQLRLLKSQGAKKIVLSTGYLGELVTEAVGDGSQFGLDISYSPEGDRRLGTGGALVHARPLLSDPFIFTYGDAYLRIDLRSFVGSLRREQTELLAVMSVLKNQDRWGGSNCAVNHDLVTQYSKDEPAGAFDFIDFGLTVVRKKALDQVGDSPKFDVAVLVSALAADGLLGSYEVNDRFYEIGTAEARAETERFLINGDSSDTGGVRHADR